MPNQNSPLKAIIQIKLLLRRRCMKNSTIRRALVEAMVKPIVECHAPRSTYAKPTVAAVNASKTRNTRTYLPGWVMGFMDSSSLARPDQVEQRQQEKPN